MNRLFKWIGIIVGGVVGVIALLAITLFLIGHNRLSNAPEIATAPVTVPDSEEAVENGRYLATISSCTSCHGAQLQGTVMADESPIGYIPAPNLTSGEGGIGASYTDADWERAIRHGVNGRGEVMVIMPANHYAAYGDDDLADLIAYLKSVSPVDNDLGPRQLQFPGTIIFGVLAFSDWSVNSIDHTAVGGNAPEFAASAEYGEYLVNITSCASCHAENLAGNYGQLESPQGPNLTTWPESWTAEQFAAALQLGVRPDGELLSQEMPWSAYALMSESEVEALWTYLNSLEPLPDNPAE